QAHVHDTFFFQGGPDHPYALVNRVWSNGDRLVLKLPMGVKLRTWPKNHNAISVDRGPLTYSLEIGEKYQRYGGSDEWPEYEVVPTTPWNYGLAIDEGPKSF